MISSIAPHTWSLASSLFSWSSLGCLSTTCSAPLVQRRGGSLMWGVFQQGDQLNEAKHPVKPCSRAKRPAAWADLHLHPCNESLRHSSVEVLGWASQSADLNPFLQRDPKMSPNSPRQTVQSAESVCREEHQNVPKFCCEGSWPRAQEDSGL